MEACPRLGLVHDGIARCTCVQCMERALGQSMRETAAKPPTPRLVIHSMSHVTMDAPCGARYEDLRFNDEYQAWCKTLNPASLDVPRCLDCLKLELTRLQDQFAHQKMLQGVEYPLGGLEMLPLTAPTPVDHLDEDLLCGDE